jgi:signal transduction histidine kinase
MEKPANHNQSDQYFKDLFRQIDQGFILLEVLYGADGIPADIYFIESNPAANRLSGTELAGRHSSELGFEFEQRWLEIYSRIAITGEAEKHELSSSEPGASYLLQAYKVGRQDERKVAVIYPEIALKDSLKLLQTIYDTTLIGMSVFAPVRNSSGAITDFRIITVNKKIERSTDKKDMVGQLYAELFPGIRQMGLFDLMVKTIETGEPGKMKYHYTYEGVDRWYSTMFVKGDDFLVSTNLDITSRVRAEDERFRNYILLQQSEELAQSGSWVYDLLQGTFSASDGLYRLFDLEKGKAISPDIYRAFATAESLPAAEIIISHIYNGQQDFEERLEIRVGDLVRVLQIKAAAVINDQGRNTHVLGVSLDITAMQAAEIRLRTLEAGQQREIFNITLHTQEQERRRISESLHNGVGQLLYSTRLSMNYLTAKLAAEQPEKFNKSMAYTAGLLTDSIKYIRNISHELMPTVLAQFGLNAAITDICEQLQDGVHFQCRVSTGTLRLDDYIELAVFRTVQELMINVVKHAAAQQAEVEVAAGDSEVIISVTDDGKGMPEEDGAHQGIGLASIRNKASLLKGSVQIKTTPGQGTTVEVRFAHLVPER